MKSFLKILVLSLVLLPSFSHAQAYPSRPITLVVPFAPGGGAGGAMAAAQVAQAKPDGYTLLFITSTFVTVAATDRKLSYGILGDFTPIALLGRGPLLLVVNKDLRRRVVREGGLKID